MRVPPGFLQQSEEVGQALLDLLLPNSLLSYDTSVAGHGTVCGHVGEHHCRCAEALKMATVTPAHKGRFHVCTPKCQGGTCFFGFEPMLHPAARAEMYSHGEFKGSNGSTLNGVSGFSVQNHGLI